jgi:hypothetical protein
MTVREVPIQSIMHILHLKGKMDVLKKIASFKNKPCVIRVYFQLLTKTDPERYDLWMEPNWVYPDMLQKLVEITEHFRQWINDAGISEITDLMPAEEAIVIESEDMLGEVLSRHAI